MSEILKSAMAGVDLQSSKKLPAMNPKDRAAIEKAAKEFEAMFMNMVTKSMRSSVQESGLWGDSNQTKVFQSMLDDEYSKMGSQNGKMGIADAIVRQFSEHLARRSPKGEVK